jgi:zinc-ribbon domain
VLLLCLLSIEGLGLLGGRAQISRPPQGGITSAEADIDLVAEPERVLTEIERELHRYWSEGIPNRRHVWHMPSAEAKASGEFAVSVLEETQPLLSTDERERGAALGGIQRAWLLAMDVLGLLMTLAGCVLWVRLTNAHMLDKGSSWSTAAAGVVLLLMGAYAIRASHLLWSRVEVLSSLLQLDCKGLRNMAVTGADASAGLQAMKLRARVVKLKSTFYADAEHFIGSRVVQELVGDEATAKRAVQQIKTYAERQTTPEERPQAVPSGAARGAFGSAPVTPQRPAMVKFCPSCGTPVLAGARFCQGCGAALP